MLKVSKSVHSIYSYKKTANIFWLTGVCNILREIFTVFFLQSRDNGASYASSIQEEERSPNVHIFKMFETVKKCLAVVNTLKNRIIALQNKRINFSVT